MSSIVKPLITSFSYLLLNRDVRAAILKPALKTLKTYLISLIIILIFVVFYNFLFLSSGGFWSSILSLTASIFIILTLPFVISYLFLSFFCDRYYSQMISLVYPLESMVYDNKITSGNSIFLKILIFLIIIPVFIVLSFFHPFFSLLIAGLIFGVDVFLQFLSAINLNYRDQFSYIFNNSLSILIIGVLLVLISIFPFAILLTYPLGVLTVTEYYKLRVNN